MAKQETWLEWLSRNFFSILVVGIVIYGAWDLIVRPFVRIEPPVTVCSTTVTAMTVLKPGKNPNEPPHRIQVAPGLPIVVPAGETRLIEAQLSNATDQTEPDQTETDPRNQAAVYQWKATYGTFASRVTVGNQATYTAPKSLVNDTLTVDASLKGCSPGKRNLTLAIVPSANTPLEPANPLPELPTPTPSVPSSLPTVDPFEPPAPR